MEAARLENKKIKYIKWFVVTQVMDLLSTIIGIGFLGFREANPLFENATFIEMTLAKVLAITIIVCGLYYVKKFPLWFFVVILVISAIPPLLNILQILLYFLI